MAWITEQKNTLSAVFFWGRLGLPALRPDPGNIVVLLRIGVVFAGAAEQNRDRDLPGALLVIFWWQRGRLSWKKDILPLVPFFVFGAAAGIFTAWVERKLVGAEGTPLSLRSSTVACWREGQSGFTWASSSGRRS